MAQVSWSLTAGNDLQDIENFIARDSVLHAVTFVDRIVEFTETLLKNPRIGRIVPEFSREDLHEVIFRNYRIVYLLHDDRIFILRVVHGSRDLLALARHRAKIARAARLKADELDLLLTVLLTSVTVVPFERIAPYLPAADALIGAIDPDDVPFVALALAEEHDGIWSNDRAFENLPGIQIWTTTSLKTHLRL